MRKFALGVVLALVLAAPFAVAEYFNTLVHNITSDNGAISGVTTITGSGTSPRISGYTFGAAGGTDNGVFNNITAATATFTSTPTFGDNTISGADIIDSTLNGSKIIDNTVTRDKILDTERIPTGALQMYAGASAPTGWLMCNGDNVSRTTYSTLYGVIGTTFGIGDNTTTFSLPDFRGRAPIGVGTGTGLTERTLGATVGEESHVLTEAELATHTHTISLYDNAGGNGQVSKASGSLVATVESGAVGDNTAHNTMQPSLAINFIIKY